MVARKNFLLGRGESLIKTVPPPARVPRKAHPYSFEEAVRSTTEQLSTVVSDLSNLPADACPRDEAVVAMTLHPAYLAKSYFPEDLLKKGALRAVGSRAVKIRPRKDSRKNFDPEEAQVSTKIFIAGRRDDFRALYDSIPTWSEDSREGLALREVEQFASVSVADRVVQHVDDRPTVMEAVLHVPGPYVSLAFEQYARRHGAAVRSEKSFTVQGLQFVPVEVDEADIDRLAMFSYMRNLRPIARLRSLLPTYTRVFGPTTTSFTLPDGPAIDPSISVAVFDAGMPTLEGLQQYVGSLEPKGIGSVVDGGLEHGLAVTSALLFGPLKPASVAPRPYAKVDHYRVLGTEDNSSDDELYDVLHRISAVLEEKTYDFVNLSIGPEYPVDEDEDIHPWTSVLDSLLCTGRTVAAIAAGNTGEADELTGLHRVQVPSDCVNAITVGACDSREALWSRAPYSSRGPGRSPGRTKPDVVAFGGTMERPFLVASNDSVGSISGMCGTSFASPLALRSAIGVRALLGAKQLSGLAIRALLVHRAEDVGHAVEDCGWGRVIDDPESLIACEDGEVHVVYQAEIAPRRYLRADLPVPQGLPNCNVEIGITLCFASQVDPQDPLHYTRSGLDVVFVPDAEPTEKGRKTASFFGADDNFADEWTLRRDAHKWETIVRRSKTKRASSLVRPYIEIHHNARASGRDSKTDQAIPFAMIVSLRAPRVRNLYDLVLNEYRVLQPLRPVIELRLQA